MQKPQNTKLFVKVSSILNVVANLGKQLAINSASNKVNIAYSKADPG